MWPFNFFKKKEKPYSSTYNFPPEIRDFFDALRDCHLKNYAQYFSELKKLAGTYPEEPIFWLFAGDILRDKNPEKALELHRDVLFRPGTSGIFRSMVLEHIARDYIFMKQGGKAVSVLKDAIKCATYPAASLLLAEVFESSGNFEAGMDEIKRYISLTDSKNEVVMQRYCARTAHHFFNDLQNNKDSAVKWLETLSKKCVDENQSVAAGYSVALIESNSKKAVNYLKKLVEAGENYEILGRSLLLNFPKINEINYNVEGKYRELFHILLNKNLKYSDRGGETAGGTLITNKLIIRNDLEESAFSVLDEALPDSGLFVCAECGRRMREISPVCPECQKITGRKFFS
ncbi:hypothetical protein J5690_07345 [bacterium]|nr:hypothetical protein [bacterium]